MAANRSAPLDRSGSSLGDAGVDTLWHHGGVLTPRSASVELRRLGKAAPNAGEMELLRAALLDGPPAAAAWRRWTRSRDVDSAHFWATDLLPAVSANLTADTIGADANRLRGIRRQRWAESQYILATLAEALDVLASAGIDTIVVKGAALVTTVYAEPGIRRMYDGDVIVPVQQFDDAIAALVEAGWAHPNVVGPFFHASEVIAPSGRSIDVHRWVVFPRFSPVPETAWFDRAVPHSIRGKSTRRFTAPDELVLAVLHGLLTNSASATRWPLDVAHLAERADDSFWSGVVRAATEIEAGPLVADALAMCRAELAVAIPFDVESRLRRAPYDRALALHWFGCRHGFTSEWRIKRYVRVDRALGLRPSAVGYVRGRLESARHRGLSAVVSGRAHRVRGILSVRRRDRADDSGGVEAA